MLSLFQIYTKPIDQLSNNSKLLINTINAHSYNVSEIDEYYRESLLNCDVLIPDGISIVIAVWLLQRIKLKKIAGADLFYYEMNRLQNIAGKCFFLGSSKENLLKIMEKVAKEYPSVIVDSYSPPFKDEFDEEDNFQMIKIINHFKPDVLMIGMTAPKQEKWAYKHYKQLQVGHICCVGAVFDFYSGTISRAPKWMIGLGLEWFYRFIKEPKRMWKRYLKGNIVFLWHIIKEKYRR